MLSTVFPKTKLEPSWDRATLAFAMRRVRGEFPKRTAKQYYMLAAKYLECRGELTMQRATRWTRCWSNGRDMIILADMLRKHAV